MDQKVMDSALNDTSEKFGRNTPNEVVLLQCDMGDLPEVVKVAKDLRTDRQTRHFVLNAAFGNMTYQLTEDGLDRHMQINLIEGLLEVLCLSDSNDTQRTINTVLKLPYPFC